MGSGQMGGLFERCRRRRCSRHRARATAPWVPSTDIRTRRSGLGHAHVVKPSSKRAVPDDAKALLEKWLAYDIQTLQYPKE